MPVTSYTVKLMLVKGKAGLLSVTDLHERDLTAPIIDTLLNRQGDTIVGMSAIYGATNVLIAIALATRSSALVIRLSSSSRGQRSKMESPSSLLRYRILCGGGLKKLTFDTERLSTALFHDHNLRVSQVIDVQSTLVTGRRWSTATLLQALGGEMLLNRTEVLQASAGNKSSEAEQKAVLRAWMTWHITSVEARAKALKDVNTINARWLNNNILRSLATFTRNADRLQAMKPTKVKNDISPEVIEKKGEVTLSLSRSKTRVRSSENQRMMLHVRDRGDKRTTVGVHLKKVNGREVVVKLQNNVQILAAKVNLYTFGKDDPTCAEEERTLVILGVLQGTISLFVLPLARAIFLSGTLKNVIPAKPLSSKDIISPSDFHSQKNRAPNLSQVHAVKRIVSPLVQHFVCVIQGPPGTGKTTVIASSVITLMSKKERTVWLVAQSNVAVKNIAEKLASFDFWDFKLLVSKDFHFDWHEHLYRRIDNNIIRSDDFSDDVVLTERLLAGARVILCTLNYIPLISKYGKHIRKLVFIGDDKQLPPYGQDDVKELRSIFELPQFRKGIVFLDTQYRMPTPIGDFISKHMYTGRLQSVHKISDKLSCRLVDVPNGKEARAGNSCKNLEEAAAVMRIARHLNMDNKRYRIITPYDGQRALIENLLKREELPWEDKCFCVDSFQGNEEDHIIVSIVRSEKVGFLSNRRRSNVMLSRCKESMLICTSRAYLSNIASETLLGALAEQWGPDAWCKVQDVVRLDIMKRL